MFENLRNTKAYKILAIYSKNNDHAGPLSGCISPQPLISNDGGIGSNVNPITMVTITFQTSIPAIIGKNGVEKIVNITLTVDEQLKFAEAAQAVREVNGDLKF